MAVCTYCSHLIFALPRGSIHTRPAACVWQTIIFIRDKNHKGQEVSGYIDFAHRLKTENFEPYFER